MSQSVNRLKQLLFEPEALALAELERRVAQMDARGGQERDALRSQIEVVLERAGSTEKFTQSVADTLDEALRRAEVQNHAQLSLSIAPLVVTTIKAELKNSQDEMVEALYPITGRLVKAYVASAIKDLTEEMNRRLEMNPVMLRLQSLMTGRSVGELALASTQDFQILELFLIRRGSGELVEHWPQTASGREHLMSGVLAAVNAFANEALSADEGALRQIDLGEETVYLRGSQLYLLAAKCSGTAPRSIEQTLDDAFLATIEKELYGTGEAAGAGETPPGIQVLSDLGKELTTRVETQKSALRRRSGNPLKILGITILLPLIAWAGLSYWVRYANEHTRQTAAGVVSETAPMQGYPTRLEASAVGQRLHILGLAPSQSVKAEVISRIASALPAVRIDDDLAVVPGSDIAVPDMTPEVDSLRAKLAGLQSGVTLAPMRRAAERAARRVTLAARDISQPGSAAIAQDKREILGTTASHLAALSKDLATLNARLAEPAPLTEARSESLHTEFDTLDTRITQANDTLAAILGATQEGDNGARTSDPATAADGLAASAERLSALTAALLAANSVKIPEPKVVIQQPAPPDARTRLATFAARHAVFFANATDYRDAAATQRTLSELAALLREASTPIRVVGYTDDVGNQPSNTTLAQGRAEKVRQDLVAQGAPDRLLIILGRRDTQDISPSQGPDSPNRRVIFEVAYEGEIPQ